MRGRRYGLTRRQGSHEADAMIPPRCHSQSLAPPRIWFPKIPRRLLPPPLRSTIARPPRYDKFVIHDSRQAPVIPFASYFDPR